jgi:hypothetical protein
MSPVCPLAGRNPNFAAYAGPSGGTLKPPALPVAAHYFILLYYSPAEGKRRRQDPNRKGLKVIFG